MRGDRQGRPRLGGWVSRASRGSCVEWKTLATRQTSSFVGATRTSLFDVTRARRRHVPPRRRARGCLDTGSARVVHRCVAAAKRDADGPTARGVPVVRRVRRGDGVHGRAGRGGGRRAADVVRAGRPPADTPQGDETDGVSGAVESVLRTVRVPPGTNAPVGPTRVVRFFVASHLTRPPPFPNSAKRDWRDCVSDDDETVLCSFQYELERGIERFEAAKRAGELGSWPPRTLHPTQGLPALQTVFRVAVRDECDGRETLFRTE